MDPSRCLLGLNALGFDTVALRAAGCSLTDLITASFASGKFNAESCDPATAKSLEKSKELDVVSLVTGFGLDAVAASGCDVSFILVSFVAALLQ